MHVTDCHTFGSHRYEEKLVQLQHVPMFLSYLQKIGRLGKNRGIGSRGLRKLAILLFCGISESEEYMLKRYRKYCYIESVLSTVN